MPKVQLWGYRCERCGHEWLPRQEGEPRVCPKCKSPYWNRPRKDAHKEPEPSGSAKEENGPIDDAKSSDARNGKRRVPLSG